MNGSIGNEFRIWRVEFRDEEHPYLHNTVAVEITLTGAESFAFSAVLAEKLRRVNEAIVRFEIEKRWADGHDLISDLKDALQ